MHSPFPYVLSLFLALPLLSLAQNSTQQDFALPCYSEPLPSLPSSASTINRTVPWGAPSLTLPNGTVCCESLAQVRDGINDINAQLLDLLAQRAAFVREATRFKANLDTVDVPARDAEVIEDAVNASTSTTPRLPVIIARSVFEAIINASVPFEECVFAQFDEAG